MKWTETEFQSLYQVPFRNGIYKAKNFHMDQVDEHIGVGHDDACSFHSSHRLRSGEVNLGTPVIIEAQVQSGSIHIARGHIDHGRDFDELRPRDLFPPEGL
jgi:hypothetical protein